MNSHHTIRGIALLVALLAFLPAASNAQLTEQEPNDSCLAAQPLGHLASLPATVLGSLDASPQTGDVDFFALGFTAGSDVRIQLRGAGSGVGTLGDPFVGVFDSSCNLIGLNDDSALGLESQLDFRVPADGLFILAATGCCDFDFVGGHGQQGSYAMLVLNAPPTIGSINGRLVNARTGEPLSGSEPPYAFLELFRCDDNGCFDYAAFAFAGSDGRFRVENDNYGLPLRAGRYLVAARANGYDVAEAGPFAVGPAQDIDVGDIGLNPPPVTFGNLQPCSDIPTNGGWCAYSFDVQNNTETELRGLAWSNVQASGTGSPVNFSFFSAERRQAIRVPAGASRTVNFRIAVPPTVADGAYICTDAYVSDLRGAFMGTLGSEFLFCVSKQFGRFVPMDRSAANIHLQHGGLAGGQTAKPRQ